jgi:hypothetical protein
LRARMTRLCPVPAAHHASPATFVHKDLHSCTHVFLRQDTPHRALVPPYSGPYLVLSRTPKTFTLLLRDKRLMSLPTESNRYTYSTRRAVIFLLPVLILPPVIPLLRWGGGGVMWEPHP